MNIVISSKRYLPILGGSVRYAEMLACGFRRAGHEVRILTRTPGEPLPNVLRSPGGPEHRALARWADVVLQVDASWRDIWPFLLQGVPWFPTAHFGRDSGRLPWRKRLAYLSLKLAFKVGRPIPVGHDVAKSWGLKTPPILNPYDDEIFRPAEPASLRDIDVLFVGRIERSKGVFVLVEALHRLESKLPYEINCVFVGDGVDDPALRAATMEVAKGRTRYLHVGRQEPEAVANWMRRSRLLVFPTTPEWIEANPFTPLEAVACGCRVIASDNGGTRENLGGNGRLVESGSVESLEGALFEELAAVPPRSAVGLPNPDLDGRRLNEVTYHYLKRFKDAL